MSLASNQTDIVLNNFQVACGAISIYSSFEVLALAFSTFRRYKTTYFASICTCAIGCILFAGGFLDLFYRLFEIDGLGSTIYRPLVILTIGWYGMVTGFALVMYSRLHIIGVPKKYIRLIGMFIIWNIIFSHFPTTVLTFGFNVIGTYEFVHGYDTMEKIQMTFFCMQEVILGMMYLHYTRKLQLNKKLTPLVRQTMYVNAAVLCLDVSMLIIEYIGLYKYQIMLKVVVYSIKLKLEFFILNLLTRNFQQSTPGHGGSPEPKDLLSSRAEHTVPKSGMVVHVAGEKSEVKSASATE